LLLIDSDLDPSSTSQLVEFISSSFISIFGVAFSRSSG